MDLGLKKVRDFAQECGCTPQNIYGHLRTYAADLEGHTFQGKGRQGVLLDEFAQDFLRSVMYPKEISTDTTVTKLQEEIAELRAALFRAGTQNMELSARLTSTEGERDRLQFDVKQYKKQLQLAEESEATKQAKIQELDARNAELAVEAFEAKAREEKAQTENSMLYDTNRLLTADVHCLQEELAWEQQPWWRKVGKKYQRRNWHEYLTGKAEELKPVEETE